MGLGQTKSMPFQTNKESSTLVHKLRNDIIKYMYKRINSSSFFEVGKKLKENIMYLNSGTFLNHGRNQIITIF